MNDRHPSLERYLRSRGAQLLGQSIWRVGLNVQAGIGGAFTALGLAIAGSTLVGADSDVLSVSVAFLFPGVVNLAIALGLRRRHFPEAPIEVALSPDAKSLLLRVYRHFVGWPGPLGLEAFGGLSALPLPLPFGRRRLRRRLLRRGFGEPIHDLTDEVLESLNRAAAQHNRISAVLASAKSSPAVAQLAPRVANAADEAMAEILDRAATLCRYPEGADAGRGQIAARTASLAEVADRLESLSSLGATSSREGSSNRIDRVIEDLRLEQLARSELRIDTTPLEERSTDRM